MGQNTGKLGFYFMISTTLTKTRVGRVDGFVL